MDNVDGRKSDGLWTFRRLGKENRLVAKEAVRYLLKRLQVFVHANDFLVPDCYVFASVFLEEPALMSVVVRSILVEDIHRSRVASAEPSPLQRTQRLSHDTWRTDEVRERLLCYVRNKNR